MAMVSFSVVRTQNKRSCERGWAGTLVRRYAGLTSSQSPSIASAFTAWREATLRSSQLRDYEGRGGGSVVGSGAAT